MYDTAECMAVAWQAGGEEFRQKQPSVKGMEALKLQERGGSGAERPQGNLTPSTCGGGFIFRTTDSG